MSSQAWFATCPKGIESLLATELTGLGASEVRETVAGVRFSGNQATAYRVCLWSRLASRILWSLAEVDAADAQALYDGVAAQAWPQLFDVKRSVAVDFVGSNDAIRNTQFGAQRSKDAIVDVFSREMGARPSVDRRSPDVRVNVRLNRNRASIAIDFSGASLHRRGYRLSTGVAPLKENLAAAILLRADWPGIAARGGALMDPLCGSATLLLEGAMMAANIAPGLARERFGFQALRGFDAAQWGSIVAEAQGMAERGLAGELPEIRGYDADPRVIRRAQENIERAGLTRQVRVSCKPLAEFSKPTHRPIDTGLIVTNPPYGERLGDRQELPALYRELGERMYREFPGWQAAVFTADEALGRGTGLRSHKRYTLFNGAMETKLLLFDLVDNRLREAPDPVSDGARMFANRLKKNRRRLSSWLKKSSVSCYRLYDADMPEYAVAVDIYGDHVHVAEYKAPASISPAAAERRLQEVQIALPEALNVAGDRIAFKQRSRQRGAQQYDRQDRRREMLEVSEGRARLLVNLHDYLDTGLFLDHRPLRLRIAAESDGCDFLNLFAYTATASVHAALGGARSTLSIDTSNTYLDWARRNLDLNKCYKPDHRTERADCLAWLRDSNEQFDLVLLDPPSFSNSKSREGSFDVQRDQVALVHLAMARVRSGGTLYFSNNRRGFRLDPQLTDAYQCENITAQTIDPDFKRNEKIHSCWRLQPK